MKNNRSTNIRNFRSASFALAVLFFLQPVLNAQETGKASGIADQKVEAVEQGAGPGVDQSPETEDTAPSTNSPQKVAKPEKPKPAPTLKEIERELFAEIQRLLWKMDANSEMLESLEEQRLEGEVSEEEMIVQIEREKALAEGLKRDKERYLDIKSRHAELAKRLAAEAAKNEAQGPKKTIVEADIVDGPQIEEKKRVRGAAATLFDTISTSSPIESETSKELFNNTVKEISEEH